MKKYLTRKNIGLVMALLFAIPITMGAFFKLIQHEEVITNFASGGLDGWAMIVGIGEIVSLILFLVPKTMRLGAMLLAAYFGGAIMFHMSHTDPEHQSLIAPSVYLCILMVISWVRGMDLIQLNPSK